MLMSNRNEIPPTLITIAHNQHLRISITLISPDSSVLQHARLCDAAWKCVIWKKVST